VTLRVRLEVAASATGTDTHTGRLPVSGSESMPLVLLVCHVARMPVGGIADFGQVRDTSGW
jgi:hypothetical protein